MGSRESRPASGLAERDRLLEEAVQAHRGGELSSAEKHYARALEVHPGDADALCGLGIIAGQRGDFERGLQLLSRAASQAPREARIVLHYATQLKSAGRSEEALRQARRVLAFDAHSVAARRLAGKCCEALNRLEEAETELSRVLEVEPLDVEAGIVQARIDRRRGRLEQARSRLEDVLARATLPERRIAARRELGDVLERQGEHALAFAAYAEAAGERSRTEAARRIARADWPARAAGIRAVPDELLRPPATRARARPMPVFLLGFPRSGTTMLEQVLAAHPQVRTTDERPFLCQVRDSFVRTLPAGASLAESLAAVDESVRARARADYFALVEAAQPGSTRALVHVDKLPLNLLELAWIPALFPDARLILALRDPRDACMSAFVQDFALNEAMIEFLTIEGAARFYAAVMAIWTGLRGRIGLPWIEVRYEDLVRDLEKGTRDLLAFLDLDWDDRVLRFQEQAATRAISTPSYAAVTEKVSDRAIGRWKKHAEHFAPLAPMFAPYLEAFGYE